MNTTYQDFLKSKQHLTGSYGFDAVFIPDFLFDYQKDIVEKALLKGRCAIFADTGLGKTAMQLVIARNIIQKTNGNVLILTPLAVAFQFIDEANKMGIDDISYSKDGNYKTKIVVTNYERLEHFESDEFQGILLDESSILKNFEGAIKGQVTAFMKKIKYRFLCTATPSPNDYIELGTSSEALGHLGYMDMLSKYFKNNQNNVAKLSQISKARQGEEWYLKPHAEKDFWRWVGSWSISIKKPSDLGYSDKNHILPQLIENQTIIRNETPLTVGGQTALFTLPAVNFRDIKAEVRATINQRCEAAVSKAVNHQTSVYWVNLNDESSLVAEIDKSAVELIGSMSIDKKEEILISFSKGEISKLITKTSITAFGLNWQHCNHTTYFPTYSYESYYQAVRRFWRFGQKRQVTVDLILSDGQVRILESLLIKKEKAVKMFENLIQNTNSDQNQKSDKFKNKIIFPTFIKH